MAETFVFRYQPKELVVISRPVFIPKRFPCLEQRREREVNKKPTTSDHIVWLSKAKQQQLTRRQLPEALLATGAPKIDLVQSLLGSEKTEPIRVRWLDVDIHRSEVL